MRTRVLGWRWRRNSLRRRCDAVEAWCVLLVGVLLFVGAPLAGAATGWWSYEAARAEAAAQRATLRQVRAVLVADTPAAVPATPGGVQRSFPALVRWTGPDGKARTDLVRVPAGVRGGARVDIWTDARDRIVRAPSTTSAIWQRALAVGLFTAFGVVLAVLVTRLALRRAAERRRLEEWARDWALTEPGWTRRTA
ncbi:hypothetical protein AB0912_17600 [Streptomyces sp. NPDC007084]|uniref:Rv1733c family protein n=1 Tax=Streptomyces sp. NPDC007084 TaxID=3154313 RepID=UPI003455CDBC